MLNVAVIFSPEILTKFSHENHVYSVGRLVYVVERDVGGVGGPGGGGHPCQRDPRETGHQASHRYKNQYCVNGIKKVFLPV